MFGLVIGALKNLWNQFLALIGLKNKQISASNMLQIFIKTNAGEQISLNLDPSWNIQQVKNILAKKLGTPENSLKIIFAGKALPDNLSLHQCDLGNHSILHAVKVEALVKGPEVPESISKDNYKKDLDSTNVKQKNLFGTDNILPKEQTILKDQDLEKTDVCNASLLCDPSTVMTIQLSDVELEQLKAIKEAGESSERLYFYVFCSSPCSSVKGGKLRVRCCSCKEGAVTVQRDPTCWKDVLEPRQVPIVCESSHCSGSFAEFYFKCRDHETSGENDTAIVLYLVRGNVSDVPCLSCLDVTSPVIVFECASAHTVCLDCFVTYCVSKLNERRFLLSESHGYSLLCPIGCEESVVKEPHHFKLMGDRQYERFQRFATEEALLSAGGVLCPRPGCGQGLLSEENCRRISCNCGFVFCRECLQGFHIGECIVEDLLNVDSNSMQGNSNSDSLHGRWEQASKVTIKTSTKPCPKCRTPTERDGGCMHMICTRQSCEFSWCWVCQTEWTRDCMGAHWFG